MVKASARLKVLAVLVALMFIALTTRLWYLQVLASQQFAKKSTLESVRSIETDALRGNIIDAKGRILVDNRPSLEVRVNQDQLGTKADAVVLRLSKLLKIPIRTIRLRLADKRYFTFQAIPIAEFVSKDVAFYIGEHRRQFPGVDVVQASVREYPQNQLAAHNLGWVGQISGTELADPRYSGYGQNDLVGKSGLEQVYERYLRGTNGVERYLVNAAGQNLQSLESTAPQPGDDVKLALDAHIQTIAEQELAAGLQRARSVFDPFSGEDLKANAGAIVVLDPSTGGVKALASWPTYDPSWFVKGLTPEESHYLFECDCAPSLNRAFQQNYTPGSTFKPIVALTALKEGAATLGGSYDCPGTYQYPGDTTTTFTNWTTSGLGLMSLSHAIEVSCDTVFYGFGAEFWRRWSANAFGTNNEPFQRDLHQFGFGQPTGVDLPGEAAGLIPDAAYAKANKKIFPYGWIPGGDVQLAIGGGYALDTPLQLAQAYGAIANGGKLCSPHLADEIIARNGKVVKRIGGDCKPLPYTAAEISYIRAAMTTVTEGGTAAGAFLGFPLSQIPVAGKTGTAERKPFQSTSWFGAMVPANNPKYVIVAMVEQGGFGSETAAPIVRRIIERLYGLQATGPVSGGAHD
ncbi:MAG: penicillin-binding protein 2 [Actinomycetota bacterium]|nr:penicillin-binding protein 2 [Actinomycetota bacterium]